MEYLVLGLGSLDVVCPTSAGGICGVFDCTCYQGNYIPCDTYNEICSPKGCSRQCNTLTAGNCLPGNVGMAASLVQS